MATILVGYDTETAAVGEALSLFTESPNFPLYAAGARPRDLPRGARAADRGARRRRRARDALRLRPDAAARARAGAGGEGVGPLRRPAAHVQPRAVQGHRLLARPRPRRHDHGLAARGAARGARGHVAADPATTSATRSSACGRRSATTAACATGPTCSRSCAPPGLRYVTSWGRNEDNGNPTPVGAAVHLRRGGLPGHPRAAVPVLARRRLVRPARLRHRARAARGAEGRGRRGGRARPRLRRVLPRLGRDRLGRARASAGCAGSSATPRRRASR